MAETKNTTRQRKVATKAQEAQSAQAPDSKLNQGASADVASLRASMLNKQGFGFGQAQPMQQPASQPQPQQPILEEATPEVEAAAPKKTTRRRATKKTASAQSTAQQGSLLDAIENAEVTASTEQPAQTEQPHAKRATRKTQRSSKVVEEEATQQESAPETAQVSEVSFTQVESSQDAELLMQDDVAEIDMSELGGFGPNTVMAKSVADEIEEQKASAPYASARSNPPIISRDSFGRSFVGDDASSYEDGVSNRPATRYSDPRYKQNEAAQASWQGTNSTDKSVGGVFPISNQGFSAPRAEQKGATGEEVYDCAYEAQRVQPINLAYVQYLMKHYPFGDGQSAEQSAFNVILLCLFAKMQDGHICVNLESAVNLLYIVKDWVVKCQEELEKESHLLHGPNQVHNQEPFELFCAALKKFVPRSNAAMLNLLQNSSAVSSKVEDELPLIWDLDRLYVRRYFMYEQQICNYIKSQDFVHYDDEQEALIKRMVEVLFPRELDKALPEGMLNWQKVAALMSLVSNFTVISGGPGTGKTTTVFKLLLLLLTLDDKNRNIMMCAPTAKAAARMGESISNQLQHQRTQDMISSLCQMAGKNEAEVRALLPMQASTVHGMLKVRPHLVTPVFNEQHKLTCDVLIVDEVSMLELALFAKLIAALPKGCKLILLGDKDQLSSVGAGMVLGDICSILNSQDEGRVQGDVINFISRMSGYGVDELLRGKIADHIALLQYSWRSKGVEGIGKLAAVFNNSQPLNMHVAEAQAEEEVSCGMISNVTFERIMTGQESHEEQTAHSEYYDKCMQQVDELCLEVLDKDLEALTNRWAYTLEYPQDGENKGKPIVVKREPREGDASSQVMVSDEELERVETILQAPLLLHRLPDPYNKEAELALRRKQEYRPQSSDQNQDQSATEASIRQKVDNEFQERFTQSCFRRHNLIKSWIDPRFNDNYGPFLNKLRDMEFRVKPYTKDCDELFDLMNTFKVLCSNHNDIFGDVNLNKLFETEVLKTYVNSSGLFKHKFEVGEFYPGKIVLITENDPMLNLVNGYVGFCAYLDDDESLRNNPNFKIVNLDAKAADETDPRNTLRLFIAMGSKEINGKTRNEINVISTLLLNHYETGYAMSIHKSQGSEYDRVAIVLSQSVNPILTKELVYTGITRAKKRVELVGCNKSMRHAMSHAVVRESGLAERLFRKQA